MAGLNDDLRRLKRKPGILWRYYDLKNKLIMWFHRCYAFWEFSFGKCELKTACHTGKNVYCWDQIMHELIGMPWYKQHKSCQKGWVSSARLDFMRFQDEWWSTRWCNLKNPRCIVLCQEREINSRLRLIVKCLLLAMYDYSPQDHFIFSYWEMYSVHYSSLI